MPQTQDNNLQAPQAPKSAAQTPANSSAFQTHNEVYGHPKGHRFVTVAGLVILLVALGSGVTYFFGKDFITRQVSEIRNPQPEEIAANNFSEEAPEVVCVYYTSVEQALKNPDTACSLDFSGQNLESVPEGITELPNVVEIDLSDNALSEFPEELLEMENLVSLNLSNNNISSLPQQIPEKDRNHDISYDEENNPVFTPLNFLQILMLEGNPLPEDIISTYQRGI